MDLYKYATHCMYPVDPVVGMWETASRDTYPCAQYEITPGYYMDFTVNKSENLFAFLFWSLVNPQAP